MDFNFHPLCRALHLSHLCFADDLLMFSRGDMQSIIILLRAFATFSVASGLEMNYDKSDIYFNGIAQDEIDFMLTVSGFKMGVFLFRYLWMPISYNRMAVGDCTRLVEKMVFIIPTTVIARIECTCRNYLLAGSEQLLKSPSVSWEKICTEKRGGGLDIVHCRNWNLTMLGKYVWWLVIKADHLWIKWVNHIYIKGWEWFDYSPSTHASWTWRKVCQAKEIFKSAYLMNHWNGTLGNYTIAVGYKWLQGERARVVWFPLIWNRINVPKHLFVGWLAVQGRLLTKERMFNFGFNEDRLCDLCGIQYEDHEHLFYGCAFSRRCWILTGDWLGIQFPSSRLVH
ncbi:uncharacterized protein LOC141628911 [Silene latifolia]|uniref:uncharacterized protein LOC141628911 n=1 Tax=Silene latifolia TaxID=37657 RepID=UPI003D781023